MIIKVQILVLSCLQNWSVFL